MHPICGADRCRRAMGRSLPLKRRARNRHRDSKTQSATPTLSTLRIVRDCPLLVHFLRLAWCFVRSCRHVFVAGSAEPNLRRTEKRTAPASRGWGHPEDPRRLSVNETDFLHGGDPDVGFASCESLGRRDIP